MNVGKTTLSRRAVFDRLRSETPASFEIEFPSGDKIQCTDLIFDGMGILFETDFNFGDVDYWIEPGMTLFVEDRGYLPIKAIHFPGDAS